MGETIRKEKGNDKKTTNRPLILATVMLAMFMGAIEATIVSTAMPAIVSDLGGFRLYSWVFSAYLLMNAVTVLIYGKLSDLYGRKPVLTFGIFIFLIGSVLCGFAETMEMLIVFRFIQGIGAGAVMPIATTIIGDIYTKEERAKIQGYLSSVWGISAVSGPALGGLLVQYASWHYVFWVNIPLGILALVGLWLYLHENIEKKKHEIDFWGALYLTAAISSLMFLLVEGGGRIAWLSLETILISSLIFLLFILFVRHERLVSEPIMPFKIWRERSIFISNVASLTTGVMLIGISSFLPAFVQGVMERSPMVAGFTLTTMSIGWPIAATIAGRLVLTVGYRATSLMGGIALIAGSILFVTMNPEAGPIWAGTGSFVIGVGMGMTTTSFIVSIQSAVEWEQRGIATATNMFMRNLGNTIGAALLGGIMNSKLREYLQENGQNTDTLLSVDSANILLDEQKRENLPEPFRNLLQEGLTESLHLVYLVVLFFAICSVILISFLPKKKKEITQENSS